MSRLFKSSCLAIFLVIASSALSAAEPYKVILQISDDSVKKQVLVLNVADNLYKSFGEELQLEIVAFGPGLDLLTSKNTHAKRLRSLSQKGVKLTACRNTTKRLNKMLGHEIDLHADAGMTDSGASHIVRLVKKGYVLLNP